MAKKDVDINVKIDNLHKLVREGRKGYCKRDKWRHGGMGFWSFGSALAIVLSYTQNSSILWAIIHGIVSWFYVIYRVIIQLM